MAQDRDNRRYPQVVSARVTRSEQVMIGAVAANEGVPVATLIRSIILPAIKERAADQFGVDGRSAA